MFSFIICVFDANSIMTSYDTKASFHNQILLGSQNVVHRRSASLLG